ncbi:MAG TPA: FdhF/YdeP family oxidoreductase [Polyangiaceae bacterium]|nr:FdhF/YdeP family oxidoreductase [Polyangiaceae bacterium]
MGFWAWFRKVLIILIPFGILSRNKPRHYREILRVLWENRGRLGYALRILRHGVCDGCSLGPRGLKDDVVPGVHLCLSRLKLLRLNTMGPIADAALGDVSQLSRLSNEELHALGRVPYPLLRRRGEPGFSRISWDEATTLVAERLRELPPDEVGFFLTSRGITNETYYVMQKLSRIAGSPHVDTCARLCHAASTVGLKESLGFAAPTISLSDWVGTDLLIIIGSNLPNNQPVSTKYIYHAKKRGTRVLVVNPFREPALERYWIPSLPWSALFGTRLADEFYQVRPGGDIAFMSGVLKALDELGGFDEAFVRERTVGSEAFRELLRRASFAELCDDAGVSEQEIRRFASLYAGAKTAVIVYSMGLTQYEFGVDNVKMVANLALARGMVGREKCGVMPIRGHSGVQGSAECGADPDKLPGGVPLDDENIARFERAYRHAIPHQKGLRAAHLLERAGQSGLGLLYLVGGNHLETMPDREHAKRALSRVKLRVHQDIVLNTSTLLEAEEAVLVLPAQTRYEQKSGGSSTSTERRIRFTPEIAGPRIAEARAEWEIPALIGQKLLPQREDLFGYRDTREIRAEMAELMPLYQGIEKLKREGDAVQWGGARLGAERFGTPDGRARFSAVRVPRVDVPEGRLLLTLRRGKQFNSMTYGGRDPLTAGAPRSSVLLDRRELAALNLNEGDTVVVRSDAGEMRASVREGPCRRGHVQGFWPECNVLLARRYDPESGEPDYNTSVQLERVP